MVKSYAKKRVLSSFLNLAGSAVSRIIIIIITIKSIYIVQSR